MFAEPIDFDREGLAAALRTVWGLSVSTVRYEAVGFGTHHYVAQDNTGAAWFVNVDTLTAKAWICAEPEGTFGALDRALRTAVALKRAGLEFVHAPIERIDGGVVAPLADCYAVSVYAYVDGRSNAFGEHASDDERRLVLNALGRMHAATELIPPELPRRDTLEIPLRQAFFESLDDVGSPWSGGPFSEPVRSLLSQRAGDVQDMFERYDDLVCEVRAASDGWVVTHGEPHGANVMRTREDALLLIDWDTAAVGPRERDLWMVEPRDDEDWAAYIAGGGVSHLNPTVIALYQLWWALTEITGYTDTLRSPHEDDANTRASWRGLQTYVSTPE